MYVCMHVSGTAQDFVAGLRLLCGSGDPCAKTGLAIYTYTLNRDMSQDPPAVDLTDPAAHPRKRSRPSAPEQQVHYRH